MSATYGDGYEDGVAEGIDIAVRECELAAAGHPEDTHAIHRVAERIRAAHRRRIECEA